MSSTKATIKASDIDFSHRITYQPDEPIKQAHLRDAIENAVNQAEGVINLLQCWHNADANDQVDGINPEILYFSLESVRQSLADIKAIAAGFREVKV